MSLPTNLQSFLAKNGGTITSAQANKFGISNERLRLLVKSGELERLSFGVYILPNEFIDKMYIMQLRCKKIIYSHETALFLHDLTDRDPLNYAVTVPSGYNASKLRKEGICAFSIKKELHDIHTVRLTTMFGNDITAYNMERTICDCLRSRNRIDIAVITDAMKRYAKRSDKNLNLLMQTSKLFGVTTLLRRYMEVLL